jgi:hypothetical protein
MFSQNEEDINMLEEPIVYNPTKKMSPDPKLKSQVNA